MKITEKKFQVINVGAAFMSPEYRKRLEDDGYEVVIINYDSEKKIDNYTFRLRKENANNRTNLRNKTINQ